MKRNAIVRIVLYTILALVLTSILVTGVLENGFMFHISSDKGIVVENEASVAAAEVKKIEIDWAAGSIEFVVADTDQITFTERSPENSKYAMTYSLSGNTLKLNYGSSGVIIGFGNFNLPSKNLVITIPRGWVCHELEIDGASLDIHMQDMTMGKLDLDGASCDVSFSGSLDELEVDGASTEIALSCTNRISKIDIDGASCRLEVTLPEDCGFSAELNGMSCSFSSDYDSDMVNGSIVYGDQHCRISVNGLSCSVDVHYK